jgi:hypothetical protein
LECLPQNFYKDFAPDGAGMMVYGKTCAGNGSAGWMRPVLRADAARHFPLDRFTGQTQYRARVMNGSGCENAESGREVRGRVGNEDRN